MLADVLVQVDLSLIICCRAPIVEVRENVNSWTMRTTIDVLLTVSMMVCTFHALCNDILLQCYLFFPEPGLHESQLGSGSPITCSVNRVLLMIKVDKLACLAVHREATAPSASALTFSYRPSPPTTKFVLVAVMSGTDYSVDLGYMRCRGRQTSSQTIVYYGIPYAEPPLCDLRFRKPKPLDINKLAEDKSLCFDATQYPLFAVQGAIDGQDVGGAGSEDCLKVDIYTPRRATSAILPVMVYIHVRSSSTSSGTRKG